MTDRIVTPLGTFHRMTGNWYALDGRGLHYTHHYLTRSTP